MLRRIFSSDDQIAFARLSGDFNDLHLDSVAARRSLYGAPVVHGINSLLWALDASLSAHGAPFEIVKLKVVFKRQISVGEEVRVEPTESAANSIRLKLFTANTAVATIAVELREQMPSAVNFVTDGIPAMVLPVDVAPGQLKALQGDMELFLDRSLLQSLYPNLSARLRLDQIAIILGTTRIVGVHCPGKYSLYSELELVANPDNGTPFLQYHVNSVDERFGLLDIGLSAPGMSGVIKAFYRPRPQQQQDYASLRTLVKKDEFAIQSALIVGGSRGLGEVAAKVLAAGGANVMITYHQGREDADAVVSQIIAGGGIAGAFQFDVLNPQLPDIDAFTEHPFPTHLYYFPTPSIFTGVRGKFSVAIFQRFCDYYVAGLVRTLDLFGPGRVKNIFCPSSIAVEELPLNLGEYAAAKVAGEMLGAFLEKAHPGVNVYKPRLPRLATDQTSNVSGVKSDDPAPLVIAELRAFQQLCASNPN